MNNLGRLSREHKLIADLQVEYEFTREAFLEWALNLKGIDPRTAARVLDDALARKVLLAAGPDCYWKPLQDHA